MKFLLKVRIPNEAGNKMVKDPNFAMKMKDILAEIKAEAAYFTADAGCRAAYIIVNIDDASQIPAVGEPIFLGLNADLDCIPVMLPEDLGKAGPAIEKAVKKWG